MSKLRQMNDIAKHRGPDGEGFYLSDKVGFGHRRLAIIDLSDQGSQPMSLGEDLTITYNGEIFNYIEIRRELELKGHRFQSSSDTEVILAAYKEWSYQCVNKFNGMWSFAIHDVPNNIVFISRDRYGIKPLFYSDLDKEFIFSSEIKQLLVHFDKRTANQAILLDFLLYGYHHHSKMTFFDGIYSLDPGHNLVYNIELRTFKINKWYELSFQQDVSALRFSDAMNMLESLLDDSINLRLRSDVRIGTCLSGGLDSSYISAIASTKYTQNFTAITAKSVDFRSDETHYAEKVVNRYNINWKVIEPGKSEFLKVHKDVIYYQEEPFGGPSIIMQYLVMKKAKEEGCVVMLDGQGGDEVLLGYDRYFAFYLSQIKGPIGKIGGVRDVSKNSRLNIINTILYYIYFNHPRIRTRSLEIRNSFIRPNILHNHNKNLLEKVSCNYTEVFSMQKSEITYNQLQKLLKYEDRNSMAFSIEARVPFLDHRLVEFACSLPLDYKMYQGWSKYILRKIAVDKLPYDIIWRTDKFGFEAPDKIWMNDLNYLLKVIRTSDFLRKYIVESYQWNKIDLNSIWKLYNIAIWAEIFDVNP